MLTHVWTLWKVCLCAMWSTYVWNSVHKITKHSSWSEISIFVIFRKKLVQKSSVFIKLLSLNVVITYVVNVVKSLFT
jgi:hypothetical protein